MPNIPIRLHVLARFFSDQAKARLCEALLFPEFTSLVSTDPPDDAGPWIVKNAEKLLEKAPLGALHQRMAPRDVERFDVELQIAPWEPSAAWRDPVTLKLPAVKWRQASDALVAYVPALGIEAIANREEDLPAVVERQTRAAIARDLEARSLRGLAALARCQELALESAEFELAVVTPKQRALAELEPPVENKTVLNQVAERLGWFRGPRAHEREADLRRLADVVGGRAPRSALLVGPAGVGKTALVCELAHRASAFGLDGRRFWSTSGSRLVSGMTGFGMWQERCDQLRRELVKGRVVLHVGGLLELLEVGKGEGQEQGMASYLRPAIASGEIVLVAECTPEQASLIERRDVALARAFEHVRLEEPTREAGRAILTRVAAEAGARAGAITPEAVAEIDRLHRRFAAYSAFPARPIRFLRNLRRDHQDAGPLDARAVTRAFSRETGLPLWLLDDHEPLDVAAAERWFSSRLIGQAEAVALVVDLLAKLKAGLNRGDKPLASFLFIGPTGVGKTEMTKALAEFMFGAGGARDSRLIRFDMSEYADPLAAQRLIGGLNESEGLLTARVREQPFAVVLLDEFEKAHPALFDLLLQVLGEGRLTDGAGRVADFRNCVVIMTSNLGAATFAKGVTGFGSGSVDVERAREHFHKAVRSFVRPEFFGRLDSVTPFAPLDQAAARRVLDRELDLARRRDGLKYRRVALVLDDAVVEHLLARGFDARHGARALKRVLERELLAPLAQRLNEYSAETPLRCEVTMEQGPSGPRPRIVAHAAAERGLAAAPQALSAAPDASRFELVSNLREARREWRRLAECHAVIGLRNEITRLERLEWYWNNKPTNAEDEVAGRKELDRRRTWWERLAGAVRRIEDREDQELAALYGERVDGALDRAALTGFLARLDADWLELAYDLLDLFESDPANIRLALFDGDDATRRYLAAAYVADARSKSGRCAVWSFAPPPGKRRAFSTDEWTLDKLKWAPVSEGDAGRWELRARLDAKGAPSGTLLLRESVADADVDAFLASQEGLSLGLLLEISAPRAYHRHVDEEGAHRFTRQGSATICLVRTALPPPDEYLPPHGFDRRGELAGPATRREYDLDAALLRDARSPPHGGRAFNVDRLAPTLAECLTECHARAARRVVAS